jgi:hypothetical protein
LYSTDTEVILKHHLKGGGKHVKMKRPNFYYEGKFTLQPGYSLLLKDLPTKSINSTARADWCYTRTQGLHLAYAPN